VVHNSVTAHLTRNGSEEFQEVYIYNAMDETDDTLCNSTEEDGNVWSECEEDEALTVKTETVTMNGKGR